MVSNCRSSIDWSSYMISIIRRKKVQSVTDQVHRAFVTLKCSEVRVLDSPVILVLIGCCLSDYRTRSCTSVNSDHRTRPSAVAIHEICNGKKFMVDSSKLVRFRLPMHIKWGKSEHHLCIWVISCDIQTYFVKPKATNLVSVICLVSLVLENLIAIVNGKRQ